MFSHLLAATSNGSAGCLQDEQLRQEEAAVDERWWMIVGDNVPEI